MNLAFRNFWLHPRSSISGICTFIIALAGAVALEPSLSAHISSHLMGWLAMTAGAAKALLLALTKDVGREETTQGMQDSHEVPNTGAPVAPKEAGQ